MHLAHSPWLDADQSCRETAGNWKGSRVKNLDGAARNLEGLLLREVVGVLCLLWDDTGRACDVLFADVLGGWSTWEDPKLALRYRIKGLGCGTEVLGEYLLGITLHELGEQEGVVFREVSAVKYE